MHERHRTRPGLDVPAPCPYPIGPGGVPLVPPTASGSAFPPMNPHSAPSTTKARRLLVAGGARRVVPRLVPLERPSDSSSVDLTVVSVPLMDGHRRYPLGPTAPAPSVQAASQAAVRPSQFGVSSLDNPAGRDTEKQWTTVDADADFVERLRDIVLHPRDALDRCLRESIMARLGGATADVVASGWASLLPDKGSSSVLGRGAQRCGAIVVAKFASTAALTSAGALTTASGGRIVHATRSGCVCLVTAPSVDTDSEAATDAAVTAFEIAELLRDDDACRVVGMSYGTLEFIDCAGCGVPHGKALDDANDTTTGIASGGGVRGPGCKMIGIAESAAVLLRRRGLVSDDANETTAAGKCFFV